MRSGSPPGQVDQRRRGERLGEGRVGGGRRDPRRARPRRRPGCRHRPRRAGTRRRRWPPPGRAGRERRPSARRRREPTPSARGASSRMARRNGSSPGRNSPPPCSATGPLTGLVARSGVGGDVGVRRRDVLHRWPAVAGRPTAAEDPPDPVRARPRTARGRRRAGSGSGRASLPGGSRRASPATRAPARSSPIVRGATPGQLQAPRRDQDEQAEDQAERQQPGRRQHRRQRLMLR